MLYKVIKHSTNQAIHTVVSLRDGGVFQSELEALGIKVLCLELHKPYKLKWLTQFAPFIWKTKPDIIQGWMYHANVFIALFKPFLPACKMFFNIRCSTRGSQNRDRTKLIIRLNALLSHFATKVINNSQASIKQHEQIGFNKKNSVYIGNGFDLNVFKPSEKKRAAFRAKHQIPDGVFLIGNIARYHPMKNHIGLINAFSQIIKTHPNTLLVLAGREVNSENKELGEAIKRYQLEKNVLLIGPVQTDKVMPALDLYVSASLWGEGFPNILGEAVACGVPCVCTDVGDSKLIVNQYGKTVEAGKEDELADTILGLMKNHEQYDQEAMNDYVKQNYTIEKIADKYIALYTGAMNKAAQYHEPKRLKI